MAHKLGFTCRSYLKRIDPFRVNFSLLYLTSENTHTGNKSWHNVLMKSYTLKVENRQLESFNPFEWEERLDKTFTSTEYTACWKTSYFQKYQLWWNTCKEYHKERTRCHQKVLGFENYSIQAPCISHWNSKKKKIWTNFLTRSSKLFPCWVLLLQGL